MKLNSKYRYHQGTTTTDRGSRIYEIQGMRLPSVTTILGQTKDDTYLKQWIAKKGYDVNWILAGSSSKSIIQERDTEIEKLELIIKELRSIINFNMKK